MLPTLIDTDPGTDDALALLLALCSRVLRVEGVTTVGGNARLSHTTRNALSLLSLFGCPHIPVARGSARPLRGRFSYAYDYHGPGGLALRLPKPQEKPRPLPAHRFLLSHAYAFAGDLLVIALGPLTNIARALGEEPRLPRLLRRLVVMGGALSGRGNITPYAEFNVFNDPEAAGQVLSSGLPITLVPLDVCRRVSLTRRDLPLFHRGDPVLRHMGEMLAHWFALHPRRKRYLLCDPLAVAVAVDPSLARLRPCRIEVARQGRERGRTRPLWGEGPVRAVVGVDPQRFFSLWWSALLGRAGHRGVDRG